MQFAEDAAARGEAGVWKATVPPQAVLALFGDEREQEVVVNPNMLRGRVALDERIPEKVDDERRDADRRGSSPAPEARLGPPPTRLRQAVSGAQKV